MIAHFTAAGRRRAGGGPPPAGNGRPAPVHTCGNCGAMWTGGAHTCPPGRPR